MNSNPYLNRLVSEYGVSPQPVIEISKDIIDKAEHVSDILCRKLGYTNSKHATHCVFDIHLAMFALQKTFSSDAVCLSGFIDSILYNCYGNYCTNITPTFLDFFKATEFENKQECFF